MSAQLSDTANGIAPAIEAMLMQVTAGRDALPRGARIGGYLIEQALGRDDIAVSYAARDAATGASVVIEEYLPESISRREDDQVVLPRSPALTAAFEAGRRAFLEEAERLTQPLHPALLQVIASGQAHGTAYRVLPLLSDEPTLDQLRPTPAEAPSEAWVRALLEPLVGALGALHAVSLVHGNVRPGSIVMRGGSAPMLLGFDSARWALADLATHPEPGFLAIEQTERYGALPVGPWTDVYAVGAIALYAATGRTPAPAIQRIAAGSETPFADAIAEQRQRFPAQPAFAPALVAAVDRALKVAPGQRPRSMDEWQLVLAEPPATPVAPPTEVVPAPAGAVMTPDIVLDEPARSDLTITAGSATAPAPHASTAPRQSARAPMAEPTFPPFAPAAAAAVDAAPDDPWLVTREGYSTIGIAPSAGFAQALSHDDGWRATRPGFASPPMAAPRAAVPPPLATPHAPPPHVAPPHVEVPPVAAAQRIATPADESWRSIRPNDAVAAPPPRRRRGGNRGWWLAAALPLAGIAALAWHWQYIREADQMVEAFRSSISSRNESVPAASTVPSIAAAPTSPQTSPPAAAQMPAVPPVAMAAPEAGRTNPPAALATAPPIQPTAAGGPAITTTPSATAATSQSAPPMATSPPPTAVALPPQPATTATALPVPPTTTATAAPTTATAAPTTTGTGATVPRPSAATTASPRPPRTAAPVESAAERPRSSVRNAAADTRRRPTPQPAVPAEPDNPRAACGPRTNFSLYRCMQTQCERDRYYSHPQCIRLRLHDEVS
jgi:serine/threonine protein kinase